MNTLITELKTRARLRLNAIRQSTAAPPAAAARLRDCLNEVAREVGFLNWQHALRVLSGQAEPGDDMGSFWHSRRCDGLLNHWFASYDRAREALAVGDHRVLLPYRRQFVVVDGNYLRELGLGIDDEAWGRAGRDLVRAYGSAAWLALGQRRIATFRTAAQAQPS
ncbi:MAG: hypothetical protein H7Y33_15865 [Cytophagales bacterium]|nr:hypothetical protein [Rhizobacter sp.]